jgi:MSHA biogenesis protein MshP
VIAAPRANRGFALIGALFVLVVLAALGAFAVRINMMQQHDADLELQQLRAEAALNSGIEYAATRLLAPAANCGDLANLPIEGFAVTFNVVPCAGSPYTVNALPVTVYTVTVTSSRGVYGTPDFVARSTTVRVSSL